MNNLSINLPLVFLFLVEYLLILMEGYMNNRTIGFIMIALGVILAAISVLADVIGIGSGGFGLKQVLGTAVGVVLAIIGVWLVLSKPDQKK
jgi:uncharacterized membrane protein